MLDCVILCHRPLNFLFFIIQISFIFSVIPLCFNFNFQKFSYLPDTLAPSNTTEGKIVILDPDNAGTA